MIVKYKLTFQKQVKNITIINAILNTQENKSFANIIISIVYVMDMHKIYYMC